ncbi:ATP-binding protein [Desulfatibacillum aliphaticivorans]|uniref:ATP-binding protein n=1 Tax=Desulfatibacillum aliphaticivorans TaxID=218208 RepID=UPI000410A79C|nr:ATP-binding protein [Desulfatibacillum aliphaticivorans]
MPFNLRITPKFWRQFEIDPAHGSFINYRRMWWQCVIVMTSVCLFPLIITTVINAYQYQEVLKSENIAPADRLVSNTARTISFFLEERRSALDFVVRERTLEELSNGRELARLLYRLKQVFGGFIDIGLINSRGIQVSYAGPLDLQGKNYSRQSWFHEVMIRGVHISDVFMGFRGYPHFVIAIKHDTEDGDYYIVRATIDTQVFNDLARPLNIGPASDTFMVNAEGVLQTPSRFYGSVLQKAEWTTNMESFHTTVRELEDPQSRAIIMGSRQIDNSPFMFVYVHQTQGLLTGWLALRGKLIGFFVISTLVVIVVILGVCTYLVSAVYEADRRREAVLHKVEYTNKLASLGRLAAGVAHEINNPLAIINEKAGLLEDLIHLTPDFPQKEKAHEIVQSILGSVDRCSTITHRLLGFARHIDVNFETIYLDNLVKNVLGFLEKESHYREIEVKLEVEENLPAIESDRGQLQQVFLNILNNAFAAVEDGGKIEIHINSVRDDQVAVRIEDNGCGMPPEHMKLIFEPFFSTKGRKGTGLGLSITYGIIKKLKGSIEVDSQEGIGTTFVVTLPVKRPA